jgi:hypothetical protein
VRRLTFTLVLAITAAALVTGSVAAKHSPQPPSNTEPPRISGQALQGTTLSASTGSWEGETPISFRFQWRRCDDRGDSCQDVPGATQQTHKLVPQDVGHRLRVRVTASNSAGSSSAESDSTDTVQHGKPPQNDVRPTIGGDFREGGTIVATVGTWSGTSPISFVFQWQRCTPDGSHCSDVSGARRNSYTLTPADVGSRPRILVTGKNAYGTASAASLVGNVPIISPLGTAPQNTAMPALSGTPQVGQNLTLAAGTWQGSTPMSFVYGWQRCSSGGANCVKIAGANNNVYAVTTADVGFTIRGTVMASNAFGRTTVLTAPTAVVTRPQPQGVVKLPSGLISLPVSSVSLPQRLVIDQIAFSPRTLTSRVPFTAAFRVRDTRGYVIRGALVYVVGVPFGRVNPAAEVATDMNGIATISLVPTARLPLVNGGFLVLFVRARKPGEDVLGGISARRLVSVRTAHT